VNQYAKDFIKILENLKPSMHAHEVFSDWLVMASAALYCWKKDTAAEEEYSRISQRYTPEEIEKHSQLLAITVEALEMTEGDFLGEVFTFAELTNSRTGQFFTPYHISHMMAEMVMGEKGFPTNRVCKISDPCCGAGGMLIAGAMVMKRRGFNYQRDAYFVGQDIDARCVRMAFIQLSLLGVPAVLICGDTLAMKCIWQRETIGYYFADMPQRLRMESLVDIISRLEMPQPEKDIPAVVPVEMKMPSIEERKKYLQGELF
jgi:type I restriction-modification system DNA methylase subunit